MKTRMPTVIVLGAASSAALALASCQQSHGPAEAVPAEKAAEEAVADPIPVAPPGSPAQAAPGRSLPETGFDRAIRSESAAAAERRP